MNELWQKWAVGFAVLAAVIFLIRTFFGGGKGQGRGKDKKGSSGCGKCSP